MIHSDGIASASRTYSCLPEAAAAGRRPSRRRFVQVRPDPRTWACHSLQCWGPMYLGGFFKSCGRRARDAVWRADTSHRLRSSFTELPCSESCRCWLLYSIAGWPTASPISGARGRAGMRLVKTSQQARTREHHRSNNDSRFALALPPSGCVLQQPARRLRCGERFRRSHTPQQGRRCQARRRGSSVRVSLPRQVRPTGVPPN